MTRFTVFAYILCSILCSTSYAQESEGAKESFAIGDKILMNDKPLNATFGESITLDAITQENGLVVIFSCNECPFVVAWEDRYQKVASYAKDNGFGIALLNSNEAKRLGDNQVDNFEAMVSHDKAMGYSSMDIFYLLDKGSMLANAFHAKVTPHVFLFDADGVLRYKGAIDDNYKDAERVSQFYLLDAMKSLTLGEEIEMDETDAIGCSIKRIKK